MMGNQLKTPITDSLSMINPDTDYKSEYLSTYTTSNVHLTNEQKAVWDCLGTSNKDHIFNKSKTLLMPPVNTVDSNSTTSSSKTSTTVYHLPPKSTCNQFELVEAIQISQQSIQSFFQQSINDLINSKITLRNLLKDSLSLTKEEIRYALKILNVSIQKCKSKVKEEFEKSGTSTQKNIKILRLNSYSNSLKRIRRAAETIANGHIHFLGFFKTLSVLLISKELDAFQDFNEFIIDLKSFITSLSTSMMLTELANQQDCLKELRICYKTNGDFVIGEKAHQNQQGQDVLVFQSQEVVLGIAKTFLSEIDLLGRTLQSIIVAKADEFDKRCISHEDKFYQILEEIKAKYPPPLVENVRKNTNCENSTFSFCPKNKMISFYKKNMEKPKSFDLNGNSLSTSFSTDPSIQESLFRSRYMSDQLPNEDATLMTRILHKKNIAQLIGFWEQQLMQVFNSNSSKKKHKIYRINQISIFIVQKLNGHLKKHKKRCLKELKTNNKIIMSSLRSSIKAISTSSAKTQLIPSAIDLLDFDIPPSPSLQNKSGNNKSTIQIYLLKIKEQNLLASKSISDWTKEFIKMVEVASNEYGNLIRFNQRHIDPWELKQHQMQTAEMMLHNFIEKVNDAVNDSQEMMYTLAVRLNLQEDGFETKLQDVWINLKNIIDIFIIHIRASLQMFDEHLINCCQHIHKYFLDKFIKTKSVLSQVRKCLAEFSLIQNRPGINHIIVAKNNNNNNGGEDDKVHLKSNLNPNNKNNNNTTDHHIFKPTILPQMPDWVIKCPQDKSNKHIHESEKAWKLLTEIEATRKRDPLDNSEFMDNYIKQAREEHKVPQWASYLNDSCVFIKS